MNQSDMKKTMETVFAECQKLREAGQAEYAREDSNAFRNFESIAQEAGLTREQVLLVYARKHWDGIISWINGHKSQREGVQGRINDLIVYLCLLRGMVVEQTVKPPQLPNQSSSAKPLAYCACKDERVAKIAAQTWCCQACGLILK